MHPANRGGRMALSNIEQVDNILVALNTSEEAVQKDLEGLKIPSFAVLEQSGLGDMPIELILQ